MIDQESAMVFWVPKVAVEGGSASAKLFGVSRDMLKYARPCGAIVGRKKHPVCVCCCKTQDFLDTVWNTTNEDLCVQGDPSVAERLLPSCCSGNIMRYRGEHARTVCERHSE